MKTISLLILASMFALVGCNTVEGFGKDMQTVGNKLERKASDERKN